MELGPLLKDSCRFGISFAIAFCLYIEFSLYKHMPDGFSICNLARSSPTSAEFVN